MDQHLLGFHYALAAFFPTTLSHLVFNHFSGYFSDHFSGLMANGTPDGSRSQRLILGFVPPFPPWDPVGPEPWSLAGSGCTLCKTGAVACQAAHRHRRKSVI